MTSKTIWFVNQYAGSPQHGMEFRHFLLAGRLRERGHRVVVVSGSFSHLFRRPPAVRRLFTRQDVDGIEFWWVRLPRYREPISAGRVGSMVAFASLLPLLPTHRLPRPDAIVVSSPSPFPVLTARRWAKRFGAQLVFEVRDLWPLTLLELGGLSPLHPLIGVMSIVERYAYRTADTVVSLLPRADEYMVERGLDRDRFVCIPNGIDVDGQPVPHPSTPTRSNPGTFVVGFAGTVNVSNAVEALVDAAALTESEGIEVAILGSGALRGAIERRARGLSNVKLLDPVPKEEVQQALQQFDACYIGLQDRWTLYRYGVSPNKLFEYMLAARPIIWAINSGNRPVDDARCGVSVPGSAPDAIAAGMRALRDLTPVAREALGANGRQYVLEHHDYRKLAEQYEAILR